MSEQPYSIDDDSYLNQPRHLPEMEWHEAPDSCLDFFQPGEGAIRFRYGTIVEGRGVGVNVIEADTGPMQVTVLPSRGMSIWKIVCSGVPFQWHSPVSGPIHPSLVPVFDPSGLGWLEGFDELLVRCGMSSNGAPVFDEKGMLTHPVHGRVANLPADEVWCEPELDHCCLAGRVCEQRLFFSNLEMISRLKLTPGSCALEIVDTVTNRASQPADVQMLYHVNVGMPVLNAGSEIVLPLKEIAPRDREAASGIRAWDKIERPIPGFKEQVYFCELAGGADHHSAALLLSASKQSGLGMSFDTRTLPHFIVWKNTADERDGYVTGLEPATNFPNAFPFEKQQRRVVELQAEESVEFKLALHPLTSEQGCSEFRNRIEKLMVGQSRPTINYSPKPGWSD